MVARRCTNKITFQWFTHKWILGKILCKILPLIQWAGLWIENQMKVNRFNSSLSRTINFRRWEDSRILKTPGKGEKNFLSSRRAHLTMLIHINLKITIEFSPCLAKDIKERFCVLRTIITKIQVVICLSQKTIPIIRIVDLVIKIEE